MCINKAILEEFIIFGFATYGGLWAIVESLTYFFEDIKLMDANWYAAIVLISVASGIIKCWPRSRIQLQIPTSDSSIEVVFGDIFDGVGVVVIPVNEFFDGSLGDHVSENSLHGQFIRKILGSQCRTFFDLTSNALRSVAYENVRRNSGREKKYSIGTVARVDINRRRYLLAALSRTDIETLKASATVHELWDCLSGVWMAARNFSSGDCVRIPLLGSGLSGVGLPPKTLVELIVTSFIDYTKKQKVTDKVILVLPTKLRSVIDLTTIERSWA